MRSIGDIVKEPLKIILKADCGSCKTIRAEFEYVGLNKPILDSGMMAFFIEKYGEGSLFLYLCKSCDSSMTLAALKPYPN